MITAVTLNFMEVADALAVELCDGDEEEYDCSFLCSFFIDCSTDEYFEIAEKYLKKQDAQLYKLFKKA